MQTLEWVKSHELPTGGIEAWDGYGHAYPECTGYLIPTLLDYGETKLANRLGDWLESIQNPDGSFPGLDGIPRAFDSAAIVEGLQALGRDVSKAKEWLKTQLVDGRLRAEPGTKETPAYNLRALAILGNKIDIVPAAQRTHYLAYALEGLHNMGVNVTEYLKGYSGGQTLLPMMTSGGGSDTCATTQIGVLCLKNNIPCDGLIAAVRAQVDDDGGVFHDNGDRRKCAWTAKFYLDMERLCQKDTQSSEPQKDINESKRKTRRKSG